MTMYALVFYQHLRDERSHDYESFSTFRAEKGIMLRTNMILTISPTDYYCIFLCVCH